MDATSLLLSTAYRHRIIEPNIEAGYARVRALTDPALDYQAFCDAIGTCLRQGLIHEPIRLPEGALQCHWHLELTAKGLSQVQRGAETPPC